MPTEQTENPSPASPAPSRPSKAPNKTLLIAIAVIVLALLAGGTYMLLGNSNTNNDSSGSNTSSNNTNSEDNIVKKSLNSLLSGGENLSCSVEYDDNEEMGKGTIYISGGKKFHGEFTGTVDGEEMTTYVMSDGDYSYIWSSSNNQGIKYKLTEEDKTEINQGLDLEKEGLTDCKNWLVDSSKFNPPSNVEFMDFSAQGE